MNNLIFLITNTNGYIILEINIKFLRALYPDSKILILNDFDEEKDYIDSLVKKYSNLFCINYVLPDKLKNNSNIFMRSRYNNLDSRIEYGIRKILEMYRNIDYICHLDNDTILYNKKFINKTMNKMKSNNDYVASGLIENNRKEKEIKRLATYILIYNLKIRRDDYLPFFDYEDLKSYSNLRNWDDGSYFFNLCEKQEYKILDYSILSDVERSCFKGTHNNIMTDSFYHVGGFSRHVLEYIDNHKEIIRLSNKFLSKKSNELDIEYDDDILDILKYQNHYKSNIIQKNYQFLER